MNIIYIVPNLLNFFGGPKTRTSKFKQIFIDSGGKVIEGKNKLKGSIRLKKVNFIYVESATNRISLLDIFCLFVLRLRAKKVIVFIRDIYIELFPEEFTTTRSKITLIFNRLSNFYLSLIATQMVFPTLKMGETFFAKNKFYKKRPYTDLPPGTYNILENKLKPDFTKKLGILYLGSTEYKNSGFDKFLDFENKYRNNYNFYILSGDNNLEEKTQNTSISISKIPRNSIPDFVDTNNIAYAFHTRPRNKYDDLTFPIKVFDFLSFQLPFFTEKHIPVEKLLSNQYQLFASMNNLEEIHNIIESIDTKEYSLIIDFLKEIAINNTYQKRYDRILEI
jgi:hypothetical protein